MGSVLAGRGRNCWELLHILPHIFCPSLLIRLGNYSCWLWHLTGLTDFGGLLLGNTKKQDAVYLCVRLCVHACVFWEGIEEAF